MPRSASDKKGREERPCRSLSSMVVVGLPCLLVGAAAGTIFAASTKRVATLVRTMKFRWPFRSHQLAAPRGVPDMDLMLPKSSFCIGYSTARRSPLFASFYACRGSVRRSMNLKVRPSFARDPSVPRHARPNGDFCTGSGYDRGHLAPFATVAFCDRSAVDSCLLSNVVPQHPAMNRLAWSGIEAFMRSRITSSTSAGVFAVTVGAVFPPVESTEFVGDGVPVPSHLYASMWSCKYGHAIGFLLPNDASAVPDGGRRVNSRAFAEKNAMSLQRLERELSALYAAQCQTKAMPKRRMFLSRFLVPLIPFAGRSQEISVQLFPEEKRAAFWEAVRRLRLPTAYRVWSNDSAGCTSVASAYWFPPPLASGAENAQTAATSARKLHKKLHRKSVTNMKTKNFKPSPAL